MPIFLDRHELHGMTASEIAEAHRKDLEIQARYGVRFLTYWFDAARGTNFCLVESPDRESVVRVHEEAHGGLPTDVIEVELAAVQAFLGRIADPPRGLGESDSAFRVVMFTDMVDSTGMTARLGDRLALEMVRVHDGIVRQALLDTGGREIKHTGDGLMASFSEVEPALECARAIQRAIAAFNAGSVEHLAVRIGLHAGEPVEESHDLFGLTVQTAARICGAAGAGRILVSQAVRDALRRPERLASRGRRPLKGIPHNVALFEAAWH